MRNLHEQNVFRERLKMAIKADCSHNCEASICCNVRSPSIDCETRGGSRNFW